MPPDAPDEPPRKGLRRDFTPPNAWKRAHGVEQLGAIAGDLAHPAGVFFSSLVADGLTDEQAAKLTAEFIGILLRASKEA